MKIMTFPPYGPFGEICCILAEGGSAALIDAPGNNDEIMAALSANGLKLEKILLTHGHVDHILGLADIAEKTGAAVYIHPADKPKLSDSVTNLSEYFGLPPVKKYSGETIDVREGDIIDLNGLSIRVMETPGHTSGSVMYIAGDVIFSGDTLFKGSIGRTDMNDGNNAVMMKTLDKIASAEWEQGDYTVYSGHTAPTKLSVEIKRTIPYMKGLYSYDDML
ncbi:MAG: MBL fold metallo-hydrolase [Oscillospiraceae bacterium]